MGYLLEVTVEGVLLDLSKGHTEVSIIVDLELHVVELLKLSVDLLDRRLSAGASTKLVVFLASRTIFFLSLI